jgi:PAS domain-containing protein
MMVVCASPGNTCARSGLMLARIRPGGAFELLSAAAWAHVLGYSPQELSGKWLRELMPPDKPAASEVTAALLGEQESPPMEVTLRCKDERRKSFRLHRRFDPYDRAVFVLADEVS